jgi:hypothetical protein
MWFCDPRLDVYLSAVQLQWVYLGFNSVESLMFDTKPGPSEDPAITGQLTLQERITTSFSRKSKLL